MKIKKHTVTLILTTVGVCMLLTSPGGAAGTVSSEESDRILKLVYSVAPELYKKYKGIEYLRKDIVKEYDPETSALRSTSEVTSRRREYFYAKPDIEVLEYKKDGKEMKPSKYRVWRSLPSFPVFDEKGRENYDVKITDTKMINGKKCYRIQVTPRKQTSRHFAGNIYMTVDSMEPIYIDGTLAKLDFPLKEFRLDLGTEVIDRLPVVTNGTVRVRVKVPIFFPDTIIETSFTVQERKLIQ
jgi:hypothetical protein